MCVDCFLVWFCFVFLIYPCFVAALTKALVELALRCPSCLLLPYLPLVFAGLMKLKGSSSLTATCCALRVQIKKEKDDQWSQAVYL